MSARPLGTRRIALNGTRSAVAGVRLSSGSSARSLEIVAPAEHCEPCTCLCSLVVSSNTSCWCVGVVCILCVPKTCADGGVPVERFEGNRRAGSPATVPQCQDSAGGRASAKFPHSRPAASSVPYLLPRRACCGPICAVIVCLLYRGVARCR
jgi:hypothetical protein